MAGPVGSGKTALVHVLSQALWPAVNLAVVTNDIYTREDAEFLIRMGVLRNARIGIVGGVILGLGRALGETMAVTMVIGNSAAIHASLLAPGHTVAAVIANEFAEATGDVYRGVLIELGLVLFCLTIILNGLARLMIIATTRKGSKRS